ncbi:MAG: tagaturonate reductase [Eggerthellaceae bacterium]|nr:tagaturonate reductase [Eggerthellaceae bacterium]
MKKLNYKVLENSNYKGYILKDAPEKVMQFGEGNFLRAFANYWFDVSNEKADWNGKCVLVQPIANGLTDYINEQEGLYTLYLRGRQNGKKVDEKRVISSVSRCLNPYDPQGYKDMMDIAVSDELEYVVSNTTEAGIVFDDSCKLENEPPSSFPGKLTQVLFARFKANKKGLVVLPCELIDNNGRELLKCVKKYARLWNLKNEFVKWLDCECIFCSTLVDRIVPGRIRDEKEIKKLNAENGYIDALIDVGEIFGVWNIEGPEWLEEKLPFKKADLNCHVVPDVAPYKKRKVRILNGAHTGFVPGAYLAGFDIVRDAVQNKVVHDFMNKLLYDEIIPTLPLDKQDLEDFAGAVADRFNNPFVDHQLISITLNSTSKWRARNMPSFLDYVEKKGELPNCLTMSFAAYVAFFSSNIQELNDEKLVCQRIIPGSSKDYACNSGKVENYTVSDIRWVLEFYNEHKGDSIENLVHAVMSNEKMWGQNLTQIDGFEAAVVTDLKKIRDNGILSAYASCL